MEGVMQIGQSQIIAPSGETVAMCRTLCDELIDLRLRQARPAGGLRTSSSNGQVRSRLTEHRRINPHMCQSTITL
jgi:hypothetical protein